ncbi:hypothetical protein MHI32_09505 [Paenibacillus sp. FSL H7-0690]|uniref:hypothetical protein n=1 Tax=Paenibacillus sp. FSL H7-0690 TaxID=2921437 RepID=UPI0030EC34E3
MYDYIPNIIIIALFIFALFIAILVSINFAFLMPVFKHVDTLRKKNKSNKVGENIYSLFNIPIISFQSSFILIISHATCSICYETLDKILEENIHKKIPVLSLLGSDDERNSISDFHLKFDKKILIIDIEQDKLSMNGFPIAPYYLLVDRNGEIIKNSAVFEMIENKWEEVERIA